ncbi:MAG: methionyl-tRNA formyltransferase [Bacteroidetes bacterium]|nr:methionyl-tRNA formyltransferase [Bacteroidota bacterium]
MKKSLNIVFMGTPEFAATILEKIVNSSHNVISVVTVPDKPAGRGRKPTPSAVKKTAEKHNLPLLQPSNLKDSVFVNQLKALHADVFVVVAFRMLPKVVWEIPPRGTFNLHASLLPQYRGAAPINWALIHGETKTGVTTFFIDEQIDTGAIIAKKEIDIEPTDDVKTLHDKLMHLGSALVIETLDAIAEGVVQPIPQKSNLQLKEAPKLTPENTRIDWNLPGKNIVDKIRGLSPFPVAWTLLNNHGESQRIKLYKAVFEKKEHQEKIGKLIISKKEIAVAVTDGYVKLNEIQLPGKRRMSAIDLLNGFSFGENSYVS